MVLIGIETFFKLFISLHLQPAWPVQPIPITFAADILQLKYLS
jgi:hypothetical protein